MKTSTGEAPVLDFWVDWWYIVLTVESSEPNDFGRLPIVDTPLPANMINGASCEVVVSVDDETEELPKQPNTQHGRCARVLISRLTHKPPQLVPSLVEIFGTDKPNPFDYEDDKSAKQVEAPAALKPAAPPKARTVWAKTDDLGVVERKHSTANAISVGVPPALEVATATKLKENETPAAPDMTFPSVEHATLIEGYVFPAHKQKLAKKVEKLVKKSQEDDDNEDIVVSDSDESDAAASDVSSADSFEISDFDDEEVVTLNDLPLFSHLWGLLSNWITHETTLVAAGLPLPGKEEQKENADPLIQGPDKVEVDAALQRARQIHVERWNSLSLMLRRPLPQVALKLKLASDRFANHLKLLTKLDTSELQQLLQLFYEVRNDSDVAVDTDVAPLPDEESSGKATTKDNASDDKAPAFCRKCRRAKTKCVCEARSKVPKENEFSTTQLEEMLQEALVLRDEYDELLEPDN
ncbi:unnamed protein product [Phytophthora fragariaefolia]|uniref:Unnamed protein product n=1 Tax=Phytophthora fragariaefolia TaxID=1490495 RepID=A0A9W6YPX2_9STRA|nr:unnamed protein product [Phytophthora fragariaefolia]